ncbi:MAG: hypothetical protein ACI4VF_08775 [Lachnospirales bacterium]
MKKKTDELLKALENNNINTYLSSNRDELINKNLSEYLEKLLKDKNINKAKAIEKSNLNTVYAYEIFSGKKNPSRDKLIQLIFGMALDITNTQRLLRIAGHSELYPRVKRDSIIIYAINNNLDIIECNELLYDMGEDILG